MKTLFPGYYRPSDDEFEQLWKNGTFVLDANILLNLYRYSEDAREDLWKILEKISDRLWIPYHAALEYQRNRLAVIAEQNQRFPEVLGVLEKSWEILENGFERLQLKKRHAAINPDAFLKKVEDLWKSFSKELEDLEKKQLQVYGEDTLRDRISSLLGGKIGPPPATQDALNSIYDEAEQRFKGDIPPGYMDRHKSEEGTFMCAGLNYKRVFGDVVVWKQIIQYGKDNQPKGIIFVTDDKKKDWWWLIQSEGEKTIGPRPELIEEMIREAAMPFYMYTSERFMEFSEKYLAVKVRKESIDQIREVTATFDASIEEFINRGADLEQAVIDWYLTANTGSYSIHYPLEVDIIIENAASRSKVGFDVKRLTRLTVDKGQRAC